MSFTFMCFCVTFIQLSTAAEYMVTKRKSKREAGKCTKRRFTTLLQEATGACVTANDIQSCKIADPEFVKCSTTSVGQLLQKLLTGIEGLDDLPDVDPMKINKIRIFQGTGPVSLNASLAKVSITGFAHHKVLESKVSKKDYSWETIFFLPKMRLDGIYDVKGRILIIPISGHGKMWIEAKNMTITMHTKTRLYEKEGHVFYNVTNAQIDFDIAGLRLRLDNLFDGIKTLEESTNLYLNENWRPASEALKPVITKTVEGILVGILQKVFHYVPADYMIEDIPKPSELYG